VAEGNDCHHTEFTPCPFFNWLQSQKKESANGNRGLFKWPQPQLRKKAMEGMLQKHLDLTTGEEVGRLKKDWDADFAAMTS
jgi:hypothetical protein